MIVGIALLRSQVNYDGNQIKRGEEHKGQKKRVKKEEDMLN